jgi:L-ribulose-5-phosphate 3-epimerase
MNRNNRREFLKATTTAAFAAGLGGTEKILMAGPAMAWPRAPQANSPARSYKPMALGWIVSPGRDPEAAIAKVHSVGVPTCQLQADYLDAALLDRLRAALDHYKIVATTLGTAGPGPDIYNFYDGPLTLGIVPRTYRAQRIEKLKKFSDFAKQLGIPAIRIHAGFIPEDPNDELYRESIETLRDIVGYCKQNGQNFLYETGTETPVTLLRAIEDVGLDNQGINLDTANFILYGKANPLDALDTIGHYVQAVHAKDGLYPTNPRDLGKEVTIPQGKVDFPKIIQRLKELNYQGAITIEREISGPEQIEDVKRERDYLAKLIES